MLRFLHEPHTIKTNSICVALYTSRRVCKCQTWTLLLKSRNETIMGMGSFQQIIFIRVWIIVHSCATFRRLELVKTALYISDLPLMALYAGRTAIHLSRIAFISLTMGLLTYALLVNDGQRICLQNGNLS